jgi:ribosomal protein L44E
MTPDLRVSLLKQGKDSAKKKDWGQKREFSRVSRGFGTFPSFSGNCMGMKKPAQKSGLPKNHIKICVISDQSIPIHTQELDPHDLQLFPVIVVLTQLFLSYLQ